MKETGETAASFLSYAWCSVKPAMRGKNEILPLVLKQGQTDP
jgi:hypothetical protein